MLTNYYNYDPEQSVSTLLHEVQEKKNFNYVILDTNPKTYVDIRTLSLKTHNQDEKLKTLKKNLTYVSQTNKKQLLSFLINSGEFVIEYPNGYFDYLEGLKEIKNENPTFLKKTLEELNKSYIHALNEEDKVATAKHIFVENKINLLPVINHQLEIIGEVRPNDLLTGNLYNQNAKDYYQEQEPLSLFNTSVNNIMYDKPIAVEKNKSIKDALDIMISKKIPSIIIVEDNTIYSILSYKDIFKFYYEETKQEEYHVEYVGLENLHEEDKYFVKKIAEKTAKKIARKSSYNEIKLTFKSHGNNDEGFLKKGEITCAAIDGNKIIKTNKEISPGIADEENNNKKKQDWNIGKLTQQTLKALEEKVTKENKK